MHGVLVGAIFGMGFIAFTGAWRSVQNWRSSKQRPSKVLLGIQVGLQVLIGVACVLFGLWFLLFERMPATTA
jgi:heme/copper-type cytochrome/quinol oxidase subunit 3